MNRSLIAATALALGSCALETPTEPAATGPSEYALSLAVTAWPDHLLQDGASYSLVTVQARDISGRPVPGVLLRVATLVGGVTVDYGTLAAKSISTGGDGKAFVLYFAPQSPPGAQADVTVTVQVVPVGTNAANAVPRSAEIRLLRPGVLLPPNGAPRADFTFSPGQPREDDTVRFDASASSDDGAIVGYAWDFGDGTTANGRQIDHAYRRSGEYTVKLTVTDDRGLTVSLAKAVVVLAVAGPTAAFSVSPTEPAVGDIVRVNAAASAAAPDRTIAAYEWDFGDGSMGRGPTASHTYVAADTYTIVLTVTDSSGRRAVASRPLSVRLTLAP